MNVFLIGAYSPVAATLAWSLLLLAMNPSIQRKYVKATARACEIERERERLTANAMHTLIEEHTKNCLISNVSLPIRSRLCMYA
jgi:cytochrome P450